jgi:succinate dehydrogenase / fumarate reductase flavoprotein subunit
MGGIPCNAECGAISEGNKEVPGLMAIGEAACASVHGANRLGCNALLDLVVFGRAAGERCVRELRGASKPFLPQTALEVPLSRLDSMRNSKGGTSAATIRREMQRLMSAHASIFRTPLLLADGLEQMQGLWRAFHEDLHMPDRSLLWNNALLEAVECANLLGQSLATLASAHYRQESRGAHWREDYAARDDKNWLAHSLSWITPEGKVTLAKRPVRMTGTSNVFMPELRQY